MLQSLELDSIRTLGIPGISMATIREGVLHEVRHIGVRHMRTTDPVDADTVFEAASLSKPLVAYAVLHLVDAGRIDLDEPLSRIVPAVIPNDHEAAAITARHVLTHTTGLPNWRREEYPLRIYFPPGSRFSYSGEGFLYLQSAVEHLPGEPLDNLMRKLVFEPLGMERSAYTWEERFEENFAAAHDDKGNAYEKFKPSVANAAYSLHTTAVEYSRFLVATIGNSGLSKPIHEEWLAPQAHVPVGRFEALESTPPETDPGVAWSLGLGLEVETGTWFHWGSNLGASAFAVVNARSAFVLFANSNSGLSLVPQILGEFLPGDHPALSWLGLS
ncbi:serine hydrolase domain-containing protein [Devosia nitrariae]|nr:serine hydrolase domain-containing protein [Devosia nitrariae]